jgi:hypothetical protein
MKIFDLITELRNTKSQGFQIKKRNGIITSTWLIFKKNGFYYYFDINQKIEFIDKFKYTLQEILDENKNANYEIELSIS